MIRNLPLALLLASPVTAQGGYAWHVNPANGNAYALTAPMPWAQAETIAVQLGGHLATVRNQGEHAWLAQTFGMGAPADTRIWIGLSDQAVEGSWQWSSGEPLAYTNWGLWEPDNAGGTQDHGHLWHIPASFGGGWGWGDDQGGNSHQAIIELPVASQVATVATYGAGCGAPGLSLQPQAGSLPLIGSMFHADVGNASVGFAAMAIGTDDQQWAGVPLPLALDPFGIQGCSLLHSADITLAAATSPSGVNSAVFVLAVPSDLMLLGYQLFLQAWTIQPLFNTSGIVLSNGLALTIGNI